MPTVLTLVGSTRPGLNAALADLAADVLSTDVQVSEFAPLSDLPHYHESLDATGVDAGVDALREAVAAADGLLIVTPEYNGGPPSTIKNAIDLASRPREHACIAGKPVAIIGATPSPGGTQSARDSLRVAVGRAGGEVIGQCAGIAKAHERHSDGTYEAAVREEITPVLTALVQAVSKVAA